jgi:hypothetical protein
LQILFHERWHKETLLGLTETQHPGISFVRRWVVDPNPVLIVREEATTIFNLFDFGELLQRMGKIKFLPEPADAK